MTAEAEGIHEREVHLLRRRCAGDNVQTDGCWIWCGEIQRWVHAAVAHGADCGDGAEATRGAKGVTDGALRGSDTRARTFAENRANRFELRLIALRC